ncbi:hypothetical protein CHLRE_16g678150v5 [Chlamydomonas reinhardtii]|uniref:Uncharacterized protein n=1 Tax=Chlamydomonas reinhardtii TaxID=3055 RepID=A0A2K3CV93_CHLRE|nr:uncharacterized protein CHLRE_16g678150v5 [Chlamydomonas reinhardtii]PNW72198.1 hypothetical protein CHLRE_16g678150v5 [Chlamydomonas reinhardtii]
MRNRAGYTRLAQDYNDDHPYEEDDRRFEPLAPDVPKASIALAIFLMCFGIFSLVAAWLHFTQRVLGKAQAEIGFTVLGVLTFMPGAFHSYIAYGTWRGWPGFSWDQIPQW